MINWLCSLIFFALMFNFSGIANANNVENQCLHRNCVAVVDAGSTGTRLHIYAFDTDTSNNPINIDEIWYEKISPGLASISPSQPTINAYLSLLFARAPAHGLPLYFYATGGMRLVSHTKQKLYDNSLKDWFSGQSGWQLKSFKTITGLEEGLYGWLAVNYQLGTLNSKEKQYVSVMDMGGASVQIAFPVKETSNIDSRNLVEFDLYNQHIRLFVHSFLGLGQTELAHQFLDSEECFPSGYQLPNGQLAEGDAFSCQANVSELINTVHSVSKIVKPAISENIADSWITMGGVSQLIEQSPLQFENARFESEDLLQQANITLCNRSWDDLNNEQTDNEFIYSYCLLTSYYYALMVNGYGLNPHSPIRYLASEQNADWTLGVVLHPE